MAGLALAPSGDYCERVRLISQPDTAPATGAPMPTLARPLGSLPITPEQHALRRLPGLALPVPTLMDAVLDLQPLRYAVALPIVEPTRTTLVLPAIPSAVQAEHRG